MSKILTDDDKMKKLMTDQLYTAVLGSIIYLVFEWGYSLINNMSILSDMDWGMRTLLLVLLVVFYICDYYYIKGTDPYRIWHFILDLIFMGCMFYAVKSLNLEFTNEPERACLKDSKLILKGINWCALYLSFIIFFVLYFIWDFIELRICMSSATNEDSKVNQVPYYIEVILWEIVSVITLLSNYFFFKSNYFFFIIILMSTSWFVYLAYRKANHRSNFIGHAFVKIFRIKLNKL